MESSYPKHAGVLCVTHDGIVAKQLDPKRTYLAVFTAPMPLDVYEQLMADWSVLVAAGIAGPLVILPGGGILADVLGGGDDR